MASKRRFQIEYRVAAVGTKFHQLRTVKYDCYSSLELFDRFVRMRGQKLEYLRISYLKKRYNGRYSERILMSEWYEPVRLDCWASYEYREMIAQKCWDMVMSNNGY